MTENEKILAAARRNESRGNEYENRMRVWSRPVGEFVSLLVGAFLFFFEYYKTGNRNLSIIAVFFTASGISSLYEGIKNRRSIVIVTGIIKTLAALIMIYVSIRQVLSV